MEKVTKGGIVIPETLEKSRKYLETEGTIVAIGFQAWLAYRQIGEDGKMENGKPWAKVGDKVTYSKNAGKWILDKETGEDLLVMNDEDVVIVHKEEEI